MKRETSLRTRSVHAGRRDFTELGVHAPPIDLSSTYPVPDLEVAAESIGAMSAGRPPAGNAIYARLYNPTVARFEKALSDLESADEAVAFAMGHERQAAPLEQHGLVVVGLQPATARGDDVEHHVALERRQVHAPRCAQLGARVHAAGEAQQVEGLPQGIGRRR